MLQLATPSRDRPAARTLPRAFTLVELLIVVAITGILVGMAITQFEPSLHDQLQSGAQVVLADLSYARSLAVANNSQYRVTFDPASHEYYLEHSGTNAALHSLPPSPFRDTTDAATRQTTRLRRLAGLGGQLELATVRRLSTSSQTEITSVEFGPLGALTAAGDIEIWLAMGPARERHYWPVLLNATTGVAELGAPTTTAPAAPTSSSGSGSNNLSADTSQTGTGSSGSSNNTSSGSSTGTNNLFDFSSSGSGTGNSQTSDTSGSSFE